MLHRAFIRWFSVPLLLSSVSSCGVAPTADATNLSDSVSAYVAAYNAHDVDGMLAMVTDDVRWSIVDAATVTVMTEGKNALASAMHEYFADSPSTRSRIHGTQVNGNFVSVIEEALWQSGATWRSQCSLAIYAFEDGLIGDVWYFAAQPCAAEN